MKYLIILIALLTGIAILNLPQPTKPEVWEKWTPKPMSVDEFYEQVVRDGQSGLAEA
jgi:hypothetical protein